MILPAVPAYFASPRLEYKTAQTLQVAFDTHLGWLERSYHIARVGVHGNNKDNYPQIYANNGTDEHYDIRPDESCSGFGFFEVDRASSIDLENDEVTHFLSWVFWGNMALIDATKQYDFSCELAKEAIGVLESYSAGNLTLETRPELIFNKYSGLKQETKQFLLKRYTAFKISFEITEPYSDSCSPTVINSCTLNTDRINNLPTSVKECVLDAVCPLSGPATVQNSDGTYSEEVEPETTLTLADTTYIINVNGVEDQRFDEPSMIDLEINIS